LGRVEIAGEVAFQIGHNTIKSLKPCVLVNAHI
jgi:hypothetical protein